MQAIFTADFTNSTQDVLEQRVAALEGGVAALALASGAAAITYTLEALGQNGGRFVAQKTIYGGSYIIMVVGYSLGRAFIYSAPEYAILKLPYQILQAGVGAIAGMIICWKFKVVELFNRKVFRNQ